MTTPCQFKRIDDGWWECTSCGHVHQRPSSRAPVRLCGKLGPSPRLTPQRTKKKKEPKKPVALKPKPMELGDVVHEALSFVGITPERVTKWLGRPCKCPQRIEKFNELSRWARRVITGGKMEGDAKESLEELIE